MEFLITEAQKLALPCFDLFPAKPGEKVVGHWGGVRSDLPKTYPAFVRALKAREHLLSVDQALFDQLGLRGRHPLCLSMTTTAEDEEKLSYAGVEEWDLSKLAFENSIPLAGRPAFSLPPLDALVLYGGAPIQDWLNALKLNRWDYMNVPREANKHYREFFESSHPLYSSEPPYARVGGWHVIWPDDDFYIPREMRLLLLTFHEAEPWREVFLSPLLNYVVKERIT